MITAPSSTLSLSSETFFSSLEFATAWTSAFPERDSPFPVSVVGSGPSRTRYLIQTPCRFWRRSLSTGPTDYFSFSPGWQGALETATLQGILRQMTGLRTRSLVWVVRFDHGLLAEGLHAFGLTSKAIDIHVIHMPGDYDRVLAGANASVRNEVRKSSRRGLIIRDARSPEDLSAYQEIYQTLASQKGWLSIFPLELSISLARIPTASRFLVAEYEGRIVGGALFVRDGCTVLYWHGATDRSFSHLYPSCALIAEGLRWACDIKADFFNMGSVGQNTSLARFKASWGSTLERNWYFDWRNPAWERIRGVKRVMHGPITRAVSVFCPALIALTSPSPVPGRQPTYTPFAERASLDELSAVLDATSSRRQNLAAHAAHVFAARMLSRFYHPHRAHLSRLLDFGCGNGRMAKVFARRGWTVFGTDVSHEMLRAAEHHNTRDTLHLFESDGVNIPLRTESLDAIWVCGILKYALFPHGYRCLHGCLSGILDERQRARDHRSDLTKPSTSAYTDIAREMHRVLRPGGLVVQVEAWVNFPPEVFASGFLAAGFTNEAARIVRRYTGCLERLLEWRHDISVPIPLILSAGRLFAAIRYHFDNPRRIGGGFKDYYFVWRK